MQKQCKNHAQTMPKTMPKPCKHHAQTMQKPCVKLDQLRLDAEETQQVAQ
jgi:hypothetical protein